MRRKKPWSGLLVLLAALVARASARSGSEGPRAEHGLLFSGIAVDGSWSVPSRDGSLRLALGCGNQRDQLTVELLARFQAYSTHSRCRVNLAVARHGDQRPVALAQVSEGVPQPVILVPLCAVSHAVCHSTLCWRRRVERDRCWSSTAAVSHQVRRRELSPPAPVSSDVCAGHSNT